MDIAELAYSLDTMWILIAAFLVFFMQAGFALVEAGFTQSKNAVNILMKNFTDFMIASLVFFAVGYGFMFGTGNSVVGWSHFFLKDMENNGSSALAFFLFQTVFAGTAATIISGAMAERTKFGSYLFSSLVMSACIYPLVGHWVWGGGWLSDMGFVDFAGSGVVHAVGGIAGLMGAIALGPRRGSFDLESTVHRGHNTTFAGLGVFILWLGWFGFNPGSQIAAAGIKNANAIALIAINTNLAAAAGTLVAMLLSWIKFKKPNVGITLNGALAGLVAITASCASVTPVSAIVIGGIGGAVMYAGAGILWKLRIDDPVGAVPVHGCCGLWGVLAVGIFDPSGNMGVQIIGALAIAVWTASTSWLLFTVLTKAVGLRVSGIVEDEGLDTHEHGVVAYG